MGEQIYNIDKLPQNNVDVAECTKKINELIDIIHGFDGEMNDVNKFLFKLKHKIKNLETEV